MADANVVANLRTGVGKTVADLNIQLFFAGPRVNIGNEAIQNLSACAQFAKTLNSVVPLETLPTEVAMELVNAMQRVLAQLPQIEAFNTSANWQLKAQDITKDISEAYAGFYKVIVPVICAAAVANQSLAGTATQGQAIVNDINSMAFQARNLVADVRQTLETARGVALENGIGAQAKYFADLTTENKKEASRWFWGLAAFGVVCLVFVAYLLFGHFPDYQASPQNFWEHAVARLAAFSVLVFFLTWTSRNYRAARHNQAMNQHRKTALDTFQAFVVSADKDMRNQVLIETTKTIFAPHVSGYLTNEPEPFPTIVVDTLRAAAGNKG